MKVRPILFSAPMVRAILDGRKTQFRRVVKLPSHIKHHELDLTRMQDGYPDGVRPIWGDDEEPNLFSTRNSFGKVGDRLWCRETWTRVHPGFLQHLDPDRDSHEWSTLYKADTLGGYESSLLEFTHWMSPAVMPRRFSRIDQDIVSVRVERLNEITEEDAINEGVLSLRSQDWDMRHFPKWRTEFDAATENKLRPPLGPSPLECFRALWESINGPGSWGANPWVWVIEFMRVNP